MHDKRMNENESANWLRFHGIWRILHIHNTDSAWL